MEYRRQWDLFSIFFCIALNTEENGLCFPFSSVFSLFKAIQKKMEYRRKLALFSIFLCIALNKEEYDILKYLITDSHRNS
jgi:hypothetical protein